MSLRLRRLRVPVPGGTVVVFVLSMLALLLPLPEFGAACPPCDEPTTRSVSSGVRNSFPAIFTVCGGILNMPAFIGRMV